MNSLPNCRCKQCHLLRPLSFHSQYTVRLVTHSGLRSSSSLIFGNHRIYQLQHAETESAPNVERLLSAETECPPKVPFYPHSAQKLKPKFSGPLVYDVYKILR